MTDQTHLKMTASNESPSFDALSIDGHGSVFEYTIDDDGLHFDVQHARRLAACWNACSGIPTEALEVHRGIVKDTVCLVTSQRDQLLSAAQKAINECCDLIATPAGDALDAAINTVKKPPTPAEGRLVKSASDQADKPVTSSALN